MTPLDLGQSKDVPVVRRWPNIAAWWAEIVEGPAKLREERDRLREAIVDIAYGSVTPSPSDELLDARKHDRDEDYYGVMRAMQRRAKEALGER